MRYWVEFLLNQFEVYFFCLWYFIYLFEEEKKIFEKGLKYMYDMSRKKFQILGVDKCLSCDVIEYEQVY